MTDRNSILIAVLVASTTVFGCAPRPAAPIVVRIPKAPARAVPVMTYGRYTTEQRVAEIGPGARRRMARSFERAGVTYPPARVLLVGLKRERSLEVYADPGDGRWVAIGDYPVLAASGGPGPKRREGDRQVPEGFYEVESLNPNSRFHVALRVSYPNDSDRAIAAIERRVDLGGDIMIHGGAKSVGCLAVGDTAAEELFVLAADAGEDNVQILLSPVDFRDAALGDSEREGFEEWVNGLHSAIARALETLPRRDPATELARYDDAGSAK